MKKSGLKFLLIWIASLLSCKVFPESFVTTGDSVSIMQKRLQLEYLYFKSTDTTEKIKFKLEIAESYKNVSEFSLALNELNIILNEAPPLPPPIGWEKNNNEKNDSSSEKYFTNELLYEVQYQKAFCLFMMDSSAEADTALNKLFFACPDSAHSFRAGFLSVLIFNHLEKFSESQKRLMEILLFHHRDTSGIDDAFMKAEAQKYKSVRKAILLAEFLPGAGFFYTNNPSKGFVSIALQLTSLGYAAYSIYTGYYVTAVLTGVQNWRRFHSGGVRAGASLAKKQNEELKHTRLKKLDAFCFEKITK